MLLEGSEVDVCRFVLDVKIIHQSKASVLINDICMRPRFCSEQKREQRFSTLGAVG